MILSNAGFTIASSINEAGWEVAEMKRSGGLQVFGKFRFGPSFFR
jgi:hypothetical protein